MLIVSDEMCVYDGGIERVGLCIRVFNNIRASDIIN